MSVNSHSGARRWVLAQRQLPDLIENTPDAVITVVLDWDSGMVCGTDIGDDPVASVAVALRTRAPETVGVPDPDEIAVPAHLLAAARLQLGHFPAPVGIVEISPQELLAVNELLDHMLETVSGSAVLGDVDPADWSDLLSAAGQYLSTQLWLERGEEPFKLRLQLDSVTSTKVLTTMGEAGISTGLIVFPDVAKYRRFLDQSHSGIDVVDFPKGTVAFYADHDQGLESVRRISISLGWPEDDQRVPMVMPCGDHERGRPTSADVRLATAALVATTRYALDRIGKGQITLHDGALANYTISNLTPA